MHLFSKKIKFTAPVNGQLIPLTDVSDEVFSSGMMGQGYAIQPTDDAVYSPITGTVTHLFPTKHAIGFQVGEMEVLLHMGIDTVELHGEPFEINVTEGQAVTPETQVATMDRQAIVASGRDTVTMVLITNSADTVKNLQLDSPSEVTHSQVIATVTPV